MAGVVAWRAGWFEGEPVPPPHPLANLKPSEFVAIVRQSADGAQSLVGEELRRAAAVISGLETAPLLDARTIVWGSATLLRAETRDGVILSLQVKPIDGGAALRITADPSPGRPPTAVAEAAAIRGLRLKAYRLTPPAAAALLP